jgi:cytochrome o ubiquinol oxidase subunit IV
MLFSFLALFGCDLDLYFYSRLFNGFAMKYDFKLMDAQLGGTEVSVADYLWGFGLSLLLTLLSFFIVQERWLLSTEHTRIVIGALAVLQGVAQLIFFLHMGKESRPRWGLLVFVYMITFLVVLMFGTLWIMYSLNDRVMPSMEEVNAYMQRQM